MKVKTVLKKVRKIIAKPEDWTKGVLARNRHHRHVDVKSINASSFCLYGAIHRVMYLHNPASYKKSRRIEIVNTAGYLKEQIGKVFKKGRWDPVAFNDSPKTKHEKVLRLLDKAIENCEF